MGGLAFASGPEPLSTPRMPLRVYDAVKSRCHETLKFYYTYIATPIEAPGKTNYGDVDFLVAGPTALCSGPSIASNLSKALSAERTIAGKGGSTISFALPWPKDVEAGPASTNLGDREPNKSYFVQVDVNICHSEDAWSWELFHHAHGDLWNILGSMIRKLGLTVNNTGLYLRIEEIELIDRKKSLIALTAQPAEVLRFLGLDEQLWWRRFASVQDLYEYAASCRYFWIAADDDDSNGEGENVPAAAVDRETQIDEGKKALKHNDRKRMNHRPVFRNWVEDFIPSCRASGRHMDRPVLSREQITSDAFERFPGAQGEYERRLALWRRVRRADATWRDIIRPGLPTQNVDFGLRAAAIPGLKAIVIEEDFSGGIVPDGSLRTADGDYDREAVLQFVRENWQRVGAAALEKRQ